uniref:Integrase core domain containing protein n=1 Tax=Solanum tuberosum TaxID=4113 RepID=M1DCW1_SOLTU
MSIITVRQGPSTSLKGPLETATMGSRKGLRSFRLCTSHLASREPQVSFLAQVLFMCILTDHGALHELLHGNMGPRRKTVLPHTSPPPTPTHSDNAAESSRSEVQVNTTIEENFLRATRSRTTRAILQDTPSRSKEKGSGSRSGEAYGSGFGSGEESGSGSSSSEESVSGSQENVAAPPPEVGVDAEMGA